MGRETVLREISTSEVAAVDARDHSESTSGSRLPLELVILLAFLGGVTVLALVLFVNDTLDERPNIDTHWGGFGGGLGGWALSRSLLYLVAAMAFGAMLTMTVSLAKEYRDPKPPPPASPSPSSTKAIAPAPEKPAPSSSPS